MSMYEGISKKILPSPRGDANHVLISDRANPPNQPSRVVASHRMAVRMTTHRKLVSCRTISYSAVAKSYKPRPSSKVRRKLKIMIELSFISTAIDVSVIL